MTSKVKPLPWSQEDTERAQAFKAEGLTYADIGLRLGRTGRSVQDRLLSVRMNDEQKAARYVSKKMWKADQKRVASGQIPPKANVPDDVIARREAYVSAPHRDLSGAFFGDPRKGFSALDMKENA